MLKTLPFGSVKSLAHHFAKYSSFLSQGYGYLFGINKFPTNQQCIEIIARMAGYNSYAALKADGPEKLSLTTDKEPLSQILMDFPPNGLNHKRSTFWLKYLTDAFSEALRNYENHATIKYFVPAEVNPEFQIIWLNLTGAIHNQHETSVHNNIFIAAMNTASNIISKASLDFDANGPAKHVFRLKDIFAKNPDIQDLLFIKEVLNVLVDLKIYTGHDIAELQNNNINLLNTKISMTFSEEYRNYYKLNSTTGAHYRLVQSLKEMHMQSLSEFESLQLYEDGHNLWFYSDIVDEAVEIILSVDVPAYSLKPDTRTQSIQAMFKQRIRDLRKALKPINNIAFLRFLYSEKLSINDRIARFDSDAAQIDAQFEQKQIDQDLRRINQSLAAIKKSFAPQLKGYSFDLELGFKNPGLELINHLKAEGIQVATDFEDPEMPNEEVIFCRIKAYHNGKYAGLLEWDEGDFIHVCPSEDEGHIHALEYAEDHFNYSDIRNIEPAIIHTAPTSLEDFIQFNQEEVKKSLDGKFVDQLTSSELKLLDQILSYGRKMGIGLTLTADSHFDKDREIPYKSRFLANAPVKINIL